MANIMEAQLQDDFLQASNHIMELDYSPDADMVVPDDQYESQIDYDQDMDSLQIDGLPQEIEMSDGYQADPQPLVQSTTGFPPSSSLSAPAASIFLGTEISAVLAPFPSSPGPNPASPDLDVVQQDRQILPLSNSQGATCEAPSVPLCTPLSDQQDSVLVVPILDQAHQTDLTSQVAPIPVGSSSEPLGQAVVSSIPSITHSGHHCQSTLDPDGQLALASEQVSLLHPGGEDQADLTGEVSAGVPPSLASNPFGDLFTSDELSASESSVDELSSVDGESFKARPKPRIDLIDHVLIEGDAVVSSIRLLCEGCEYSLFQRMSSDCPEETDTTLHGDEVLLLGEIEHQYIYRASLNDLFQSLRNIFPDFVQTDHNELVLSFPDLEARIPEDNVYTTKLSLFDMNRLHVGASLPGRLTVSVEKQPRLIHRFNVLAKHVWEQKSLNNEGIETVDPEEFQEDEYDPELLVENGDDVLQDDPVEEASEPAQYGPELAGKGDLSDADLQSNAPPVLEGAKVSGLQPSSEPFDRISSDEHKEVQSAQISPIIAGHELRTSECEPTDAPGPTASASVKDVPQHVDIACVPIHPVDHESLEAGPPIPARVVSALSEASSKTLEGAEVLEDQALNSACATDSTADGDEVESDEPSQKVTPNQSKVETFQSEEAHILEGSSSKVDVHPQVVTFKTSSRPTVLIEDVEAASNRTVLGYEAAADEFESEELTDAEFHELIDTSPLSQAFVPSALPGHVAPDTSPQKDSGIELRSQVLFSSHQVNQPRISGLAGSHELSVASDLKKRSADPPNTSRTADEQDPSLQKADSKRTRKC